MKKKLSFILALALLLAVNTGNTARSFGNNGPAGASAFTSPAELAFTLKPPIPYINTGKGKVSKVTVTFNGDPASARGFTWFTGRASTCSNLQIVEKTSVTPNFGQAANFFGRHTISTNSPMEYVHKAEATSLKADTEYFYRVGDAALNLWSEVGTFRTAPAGGAFSFIDLTDPQAGSEAEAILSSQTVAKALTTVPGAGFIAVNGDLVDDGSNERHWQWLLEHARTSLLSTTLLPAAGNHEAQQNNFIDHFDISPANNSKTTSGAYYSINYSNAHFIVLNNNEDSPAYADFTPAQIQWLKEDAQAARAAGAQWLIAIMHKGPYTTSHHATDDDIMGPNGVRTLVAPVMSELGIDLVLQGHDHIYARSKPIKNGAPAPDGTIYLIPGTAGAKVYPRNTEIAPSYFNLFEMADEKHAVPYGPGQIQNFAGITIDGGKLTAVSYEINQAGESARPYIIDRFSVTKQAAPSP